MKNLETGQSTFEYIIFFTATVLVMLTFFTTKGFFRSKVESSLNMSVDIANSMVDSIEEFPW